MPILDADVQLLASQVLADVPEGGGAATGNEIEDGVSNNLFDDISELDRVYGDVSLRKVFVAVRTPDVDRYLGAHAIVADPPDDPDVSAVLFSTEDFFDERAEAASRIEAYLAQGPAYQGLLYGNHLAGQMTLMLIQRVNSAIPPIGTTLCLRKNEGLESEFEQFVRVTDVESNEATFTDINGDFTRLVVVLSISDQLRGDFPGFAAARVDSSPDYTNKTRVYDTVVADAARYFGVTPLAEDIELGDFSAQTAGIFTQLVPSSRAETPITDARMNQQSVGQGAGGAPVTRTINTNFSSTQAMFVGGGLLPGSVSISYSGITLTDQGGQLIQGGIAVGAADYENGILSLSSDVWGDPGSGAYSVTYTPSSPALAVTESVGVRVTAQNQRLTWVFTLEPVPQRASLQVSYMAQGRWYVLREDGSGGVRGSDSSFGAGNLNYDTGTVALTLGAMPDVNSAIILTYVPGSTAVPLVGTDIALDQRFAAFIDMGAPVRPGTLSITWTYSGAKEAEDDGEGLLTGDAAGRVFYADGRIYFSPNLLPTPGTSLTINRTAAAQVANEISAFTNGGSTWTTTLATPVRDGSVEFGVVASAPVRAYPGTDTTSEFVVRVFDAGGVLYVRSLAGDLAVGTVDYVTGAVVITKVVSGYQAYQGVWSQQTPIGDAEPRIVYEGQAARTFALTFLNGAASTPPTNPPWAWWSGALDDAGFVRYASTDGSTTPVVVTMDSIILLSAADLAETPAAIVRMG